MGAVFKQGPLFHGGLPPYTMKVIGGVLPGGLRFNSGYELTGTPNQAGKFAFILQVEDQFGRPVSQAFRMNIAPLLKMTTTTLKSGIVGKKYSATLKSSGGGKPYAWSIVSGSLPPGLTLNGSAGVISGNPQQAGIYNVTVKVADPFGGAVQTNFTLTIH